MLQYPNSIGRMMRNHDLTMLGLQEALLSGTNSGLMSPPSARENGEVIVGAPNIISVGDDQKPRGSPPSGADRRMISPAAAPAGGMSYSRLSDLVRPEGATKS
jgi:hypothetical protein